MVAVIALTAVPRALLRRDVLLPALMSMVPLVSSTYHHYLYHGELGALSSLWWLSAIKGQLSVIIKHVSDVTCLRGFGSAL